MKKICMIIVIMSFTWKVYGANTWYISTIGSDSNLGTKSSPFKSIQKGIDNSSETDTVLINPGKYIENIDFHGKNIVIGSLFLITHDTTYISSTIIDGNKKKSVVNMSTNEPITSELNGLTITNGLSASGAGIHMNNGAGTLKNLIIKNNGDDWGSAIYTDRDLICENTCIIENYGAMSVILVGTGNATFKNCIMVNNSTRALYTQNTANVIIVNSTITNNSLESVFDNTSNTIIKNSVFLDSIAKSNYSVLDISYSLLSREYDGIGNIFTLPFFVNESKRDYHLSDYSPGIGAGSTTDSPIKDYEGNFRPNPSNSRPDMGAYENSLGFPKILFNNKMCLNDTLTLTYQGLLLANMHIEWNFTGAIYVDTITNIKRPKVKWNVNGIKAIQFKLFENGVEVNEQKDSIIVYDHPTSDFLIDKNSLCGNDTVLVSYTGTGTSNANYNWNFNKGNIISGSGRMDHKVNWTISGLKTISLIVEENGCKSLTNNKQIEVLYFSVNSGSDKTITCGGNVQFDNPITNYSGLGVLTYAWSPKSGLNDSTLAQPTAEITANSKYILTITTPNGCIAKDTVKVTYSPCTEVESEILHSAIIYPNPASNILSIKNIKSTNALIMIYDIEGKLVLNQPISSSKIDISNLSKGIYTVKIIDRLNVFINKLIKE